jgi:hypothetical protein
MNNKLDKLDKFFKNKTKYDDKWMEQINDEYLLEKELDLARNNMENEKTNFEQKLILDHQMMLEEDIIREDEYNKLIDFVCSKEEVKWVHTFFYINNPNISNNETNYNFTILRNADNYTSIYLELNFDSYFDDLPLRDKYILLNGDVTLTIGGSEIITLNIITCIFYSICRGGNIKQENNMIQIELFNFNTLINDYYKKTPPGIPIISLQYHNCNIIIKFNQKINNINMKLLINGIYLDFTIRRELCTNGLDFLIFTNTKIINDNNKDTINVDYFYTKFFLIYYIPNNDCMNDLFIEYPEITDVSLMQKKYNKITELSNWSSENILSFEIFDIKIYVLPMSRDLSTWKYIDETMKDPLNKMSLNNIRSSYKELYYLNIDALDNDSFKIMVNEIKPNILKIMSGMGCLAYGL